MSKKTRKNSSVSKAKLDRTKSEKYDDYRSRRRNFVFKIDQLIQRQGSDEDADIFGSLYKPYGLLEPRYPFPYLYAVYEECDVLRACIDSYVDNIDGCNYDFEFLGDDRSERNSPDAVAQYRKLKDFFENVNEDESFAILRKKIRRDLEVTGNAAVEVIRNVTGDIEMLYHVPITHMRMTELQADPIRVDRLIPRNGKLVPIKVNKRFRRFARIVGTGRTKVSLEKVVEDGKVVVKGGEFAGSDWAGGLGLGTQTITWFKEFGDPRTLDATTGLYDENTTNRATEIWWLKLPLAGHSYGAPRWIGSIKTVKGRCLAEFVNYDIFLNQGIPPVAILVKGGKLTDASWDDIENGFEQWRDPRKFNRTLILQVEGDQDGFESSSSPSLEIKNLRDSRAEEFLFENYLKFTEETIRKVFRLPAVFTGASDGSAYAAESEAEQQIFQPARFEFDEKVNFLILRGEFRITNWKFTSKGPQITGIEQFSRIINSLTRGGALSINNAIRLANEILGFEMSVIPDEWANLPFELVKIYASADRLKGAFLDNILKPLEVIPSIEVPVAKNEELSDASKLLYEAMLAVDKEIETAEPREITEEDYNL